jgi:hypothetical protein
MTSAFMACLGIQLGATTATGAIAYDNITSAVPSSTVVYTALPWQAEDTRLAAGSDLTVTRVELLTRLSSNSPAPTFTGSITMHVCLKAPAQPGSGQPGAIVASASLPHTWTAGSSDLLVFDLPPVAVPNGELWIVWQFANQTGQGVLPTGATPFVVQTVNAPSIGTTTVNSAAAPNPTGPWQLGTDVSRFRAVRITTVPAPTTLALAGLACLAARRRTRRD